MTKVPYEPEELVKLALKAKESAYVPYSGFHVGAALVGDDDNIYTGCNIENSSYGATICAERTAVVKAVSNGARKIKAIAVASDHEISTIPCGICLQVLSEFCQRDTLVYLSNHKGEYKACTFEEVFPYSFKLNNDI
ncbi:MAG: cytidine deaminase [Clostridiaceae bacterium]|nr:cytidine deaminase [Clostridiaceae bacterium]